jgi:hypothetical protein
MWHILDISAWLFATVFKILRCDTFETHINFVFRQEKLELLAARFDRKAGMREIWLSENQKLVSQVRWEM